MVAAVFFSAATWPLSAGKNAAAAEKNESEMTERVRIHDLVVHAYENNPAIQQARAQWKSVVENYRVITGYPDPQLLVTYFPEPIETRLGPQDWTATLMQVIPFPGRLSKAGAIVQADAQIARLNLDKTIRDVIVSIYESYFELFYIQEAVQVARKNLELLQHLRKVAESAYAREQTAFIDVVRAQSQQGQLQYDILLLEELAETEKARLNGILSRPPDAPFGRFAERPVQPIDFTLDALYRLSEVNREEIRIAEAGVERAGLQVELAGYEYLPEFRIGVFYSSIGEPEVPVSPPDAGRDAVGVQAGFSVPLWFGKNSGRTAQAQAGLVQARANRTARVNETFTGIRAAFFRLQNAGRLMELYSVQLLPQAAKAMEVAESWFQEGQGSFSDFVETQAVWYNFNLSLARARSDYGKSLARLEGLVGQSLSTEGGVAPERLGKETP
jgi:outer membrane protein TolC